MSEENSDTEEEEEEEIEFGAGNPLINVVDELLRQQHDAEDDERSDNGEAVDEEDDVEDLNLTSFDQSLPSSHSYMGNDMEELHGRTVHVDGQVVLLPLFYRPGLVIVPGQTLPLNLFHPQLISMMKKVIAADKTFGLIFSKSTAVQSLRDEDDHGIASVGVTCEIYSVKEEEQYGVAQMSIKAEGRQRFKLLNKNLQMDGVVMGKILILPDRNMPPYPPSGQYFSQLHTPNSITSQVMTNKIYVDSHPWKRGESRYMHGFKKKDIHTVFTSISSVPGWVYKLYNPYFLMDCLLNEIYSWNQNLDFACLPTNPIEFSHWITANLPLTYEMKIELIRMDSASLRMRQQLHFMSKCATTLACVECESVITDKNDLFSLSRKGPMGAYVNPGGHVHETLTFYKAKNLSLSGSASTQYSWFPGYAWTIASCKRCHTHMGWKFTAAKKGLSPNKFWGLTRASLRPVYKELEVEEEPQKPSRATRDAPDEQT